MIDKPKAEKDLRSKGYDCELKDGIIIFHGVTLAAAKKAVKEIGYTASFGISGGAGEKSKGRKGASTEPEEEQAENPGSLPEEGSGEEGEGKQVSAGVATENKEGAGEGIEGQMSLFDM